MIDPAALEREIVTDGPLEASYLTPACAQLLEAEVWGQGFAAPVFSDHCRVISQKLVAGKHTRLQLEVAGCSMEAIRFNWVDAAPAHIEAAFRLTLNEYNGLARAQLVIEAWEEIAA